MNNMYNVPQKINELSFTSTNKNIPQKSEEINNNLKNPNLVRNAIQNTNHQSKTQTANNANNIMYNESVGNVEYFDQYGNPLVLINGQFIDKRLLVNKKVDKNIKDKQMINQNLNITDKNLTQNTYINQENNQFSNTYPLPGQKTYSTQTLINENFEQNVNKINNINYQNQNYSQRSNRFLEDQNFTNANINANINNYNINLNLNQQNPLINDINNLFNKSNSGQITQPDIQTIEPQKPKKRRPVFKIPPSKKRSISQGRSLAFIHKYYDENFILEEENEDNASDSENKKKEKNFKDVVKEVVNIRRLIPNKNQEEEKNVIQQNNENDNNLKINEEIKSDEIDKKEEEEKEENNNNVIRLSHMGFSLERSSFKPENENNNINNEKNNNNDEDINNKNNDKEKEMNNENNDKYNFDDLNIDKNIYEEKKIDLDELSPKIKRNIDMNLDEDDDDKINIDKIDEKLNEKLKLYTEKEKQNSQKNKEQELNEKKLSGDIPNPYKNMISENEKDYQKSKSDEVKKDQKISSKPELENNQSNNFSKNTEDIIVNNSSISNNLLRESDISNINPKFYEPIKDSIRDLKFSDFKNNENTEEKRINMNIEGFDLDKYFNKENEKNEIKKVDSSLRTLKSEENDRNSQQIVDNLEEEEKKNKNIQSHNSGDIKTNNEKLTTINDIITQTEPEDDYSKKFIKKNSK